jgi:molecular chaperone HtpG
MGIDGVAFILNAAPSATAKQQHRVYLKNMFMSEVADNLLPPWVFFVKLVVNENKLKPTASREGFQEDATLRKSRDALGNCLRRYLIELSEHDPEKLTKLILIHHLTIKALALADDEFYRIVFDWLPVETSAGDMTLGEYRSQHEVLRYAPSLEQFQQMAQVAAAQDMCIINGGYIYINELLEKYVDVFEEGRIERVAASDMVEAFSDLNDAEQAVAETFARQADLVLRPLRCYADVKKFAPVELPVLYTTSAEGQFFRSIEQSQEIANPLWSSVLDNLTPKAAGSAPFSQICFNFNNQLIQRLLTVSSREVLRRSIQMLYIQSLLLGHHPLNSSEMKLLNEGLLSLIDLALNQHEEQR